MKKRMGKVIAALLFTTTALAAPSARAMSAATVNGTYKFTNQKTGFYAGSGGTTDSVHGSTGTITFDGAGTCSLSYRDQGFETAIGGSTVSAYVDSKDNDACTYTVTSGGAMLLSFPDGGSKSFQVSQSGNVIIAASANKDPQDTGTQYWIDQLVAVRSGSGMNNASLSGTFHFVSQEFNLWQDSGSAKVYDSIYGNTGTVLFDGNGGCTLSYSGSAYQAGITADSGVTEWPESTGPVTCGYTVSANGHVSLTTPDGAKEFELSPDGAVLIGGSPYLETTSDGTGYNADQLAAVKQGGNFSYASVAGSYNFLSQESTFWLSNGVTDMTWLNKGTLVLGANGTCTMSYRVTEYEADITWNSGVAEWPYSSGPVPCSYTVSPSGQVTLNMSGESGTIVWFSPDSQFMIVGGPQKRISQNGTDYESVQIFGTRVPTEVTCGQPLSLTVPATDADGSYVVSWGASATKGVTYILQEATDAAFTDIVQTYSTTAVSQPFSRENGTYFYRVKATAPGYADSAWKTAAAGCAVPGTALPALTTLTVPLVDADGSYTVSWSPSTVQGVTYVLQEATNSTFTGAQEVYRGTEASASLSGHSPGTTYFYRVKAVEAGYKDGLWKSLATGCKVIGPDVPAAAPLTITVPLGDPDGAYTVSWGASATKGVSYLLEEATDAAFTQNVIDYPVTGITKAISGKSLATTYFYRVKAMHPEYVDSSWKTAVAGCAVPGTILATLTSLVVPAVDADGAYTVSWGASAVPGVTYVLQEATNATFTGAQEVYRGSDTSAAITGKSVGVTYFYRVRAIEGGYKDSAWKSLATGCKVIGQGIPAAAPLTITVPASDLDGVYRISWGASATKGVTYILEEAIDAGFTQNVVDYPVSGLAKAITKTLPATFYYRVKAVHPEYADSTWKAALAPCRAPGTIIATPATLTVPATYTDGTISLSWSAAAVPGVSYVVQEAANSTFTAGVRDVYAGIDTATVVTVPNAGPTFIYYYRVKAVATGYKDSAWKSFLAGCKYAGFL